MALPPGFHATPFAGEPAVHQPIAFTIDERGRLWVLENYAYPHWELCAATGRCRCRSERRFQTPRHSAFLAGERSRSTVNLTVLEPLR